MTTVYTPIQYQKGGGGGGDLTGLFNVFIPVYNYVQYRATKVK
jgi:hypothetical protein